VIIAAAVAVITFPVAATLFFGAALGAVFNSDAHPVLNAIVVLVGIDYPLALLSLVSGATGLAFRWRDPWSVILGIVTVGLCLILWIVFALVMLAALIS
jgi:hypothetical protein